MSEQERTTRLQRRTVATNQGAVAGNQQAAPTAAPGGTHVERASATPGEKPDIFKDITADFEARDGDVLVMSYGEVTVPMPKPYSLVRVGGTTYSRRLVAGDDPVDQARKVHAYLKSVSEKAAVEKLRTWVSEIEKVSGGRSQ